MVAVCGLFHHVQAAVTVITTIYDFYHVVKWPQWPMQISFVDKLSSAEVQNDAFSISYQTRA